MAKCYKVWPYSQPASRRKQCQKPGVQAETTQFGITSKETEFCPVLESNSESECFGKEWPKLVLLRRRHLQPASQDSQPDTRTQAQPDLSGKNHARVGKKSIEPNRFLNREEPNRRGTDTTRTALRFFFTFLKPNEPKRTAGSLKTYPPWN